MAPAITTSIFKMAGIAYTVKLNYNIIFPKFASTRIAKIVKLFEDPNVSARKAAEVCASFNRDTKEVSMSRLPTVATSAVLRMMQEGEIHYGHENVKMCAIAFQKELEFWAIPVHSMEPCCRSEFASKVGAANIQAERIKFVRDSRNKKSSSTNRGRTAYFQAFQMLISLCVNFMFILGLCVESDIMVKENDLLKRNDLNSSSLAEVFARTAEWTTALHYIHGSCVVFFLVQTVGHITLLLVYSERRTTRNILLIIIDVVVLIPVLVRSVLDLRGNCERIEGPNSCSVFSSLIGFVTMRIVRFSPFLQLVFFSIFSSWKEIVQFAMLLFGFSAILAGFSLYIEPPSNLVDPIEAFYFAVVSLLTVGFGDHAPVSTQLKILVSLVLCLWLLSSTISLGIIMSNVSNISDTILNAEKSKQEPKQRVTMHIRRMSEIKIAGV